tara:strand:- start:79 stop:375 length:297 start_codon:yes stop_codon:yes gene_type:complete
MRKIIKKVLDRHKDGQGNMYSDSFRESLAVEIEAVLLSEDTQGLPYHTNHLADDDSPFHHDMYPWHTDDKTTSNLVEEYNRNRPIEQHIKTENEIPND